MDRKEAEKLVEHVVKQLKDIREQKGLSHEKIAKIAKLHRSTIGLIENGKRQPTLLSCIKIADALEINLRDIL